MYTVEWTERERLGRDIEKSRKKKNESFQSCISINTSVVSLSHNRLQPSSRISLHRDYLTHKQAHKTSSSVSRIQCSSESASADYFKLIFAQ